MDTGRDTDRRTESVAWPVAAAPAPTVKPFTFDLSAAVPTGGPCFNSLGVDFTASADGSCGLPRSLSNHQIDEGTCTEATLGLSADATFTEVMKRCYHLITEPQGRIIVASFRARAQ